MGNEEDRKTSVDESEGGKNVTHFYPFIVTC